MGAEYIAVDVGGISIKYGVLDEKGTFLKCGRCDTPADGAAIIETVLSLIRGLLEAHTVQGVCMATAGMVDPESGILFFAPDTMPGYTYTNWKTLVESEFGLPCVVDNDVNCAGIAEYRSGAAKNAASCLVMTIGSHIGGCFMVDGRIWRGHALSACQIGYLPMYGSVFDTLASADALRRKVMAKKNNLGLLWTGEQIFDEAMKGDRECVQAIDEMCDVLGRGISTVCYVVNPEIVVLGGGIMEQHRYLMPRIRQAMEKYLMEQITTTSFVASAVHGSKAPMLGALYRFLGRGQEGSPGA